MFDRYLSIWNRLFVWEVKKEGFYQFCSRSKFDGQDYSHAMRSSRLLELKFVPTFVGRRIVGCMSDGVCSVWSPLAETFRCSATIAGGETGLPHSRFLERLDGVENALAVNVFLHGTGDLFDFSILALRAEFPGRFTFRKAVQLLAAIGRESIESLYHPAAESIDLRPFEFRDSYLQTIDNRSAMDGRKLRFAGVVTLDPLMGSEVVAGGRGPYSLAYLINNALLRIGENFREVALVEKEKFLENMILALGPDRVCKTKPLTIEEVINVRQYDKTLPDSPFRRSWRSHICFVEEDCADDYLLPPQDLM
jgi:hypothetical protein